LGLGYKKKGNLSIPNLFPHKKSLIEELERKKQTNSRQDQIDSLKENQLKSNFSEQNDIEKLIKESEESKILYEQKEENEKKK